MCKNSGLNFNNIQIHLYQPSYLPSPKGANIFFPLSTLQPSLDFTYPERFQISKTLSSKSLIHSWWAEKNEHLCVLCSALFSQLHCFPLNHATFTKVWPWDSGYWGMITWQSVEVPYIIPAMKTKICLSWETYTEFSAGYVPVGGRKSFFLLHNFHDSLTKCLLCKIKVLLNPVLLQLQFPLDSYPFVWNEVGSRLLFLRYLFECWDKE